MFCSQSLVLSKSNELEGTCLAAFVSTAGSGAEGRHVALK